jgi:hypothetical protein
MCKVLLNISVSFSLIFLLVNIAEAQIQKPGVTLGGYVIYAKPKGDFAKAYRFGGGGEVFGGAGFGKTFIIATAGFSQFKAGSDSHLGTLTYTPVKIGVRQFIFRKVLFINADLGMATVKNKTFNEMSFTRGIGAGAKLLGLQAALYYDGWKNKKTSGFSNSMNFKVGWGLSL